MDNGESEWLKDKLEEIPVPNHEEMYEAEVSNLTSDEPIETHEELNTVVSGFIHKLSSQDQSSPLTQRNEWIKDVCERVIKGAKPVFDEKTNDYRSYCPLCGQGTTTPYSTPYPKDIGFNWTEGLRRHLLGKSAHQCDVMKETKGIVKQSLSNK